MGSIQEAIVISRVRKIETYNRLIKTLSEMIDTHQTITIYSVAKRSKLSRAYFYDNGLAHTLTVELRDANGAPDHQRAILQQYEEAIRQLEVEYDQKEKDYRKYAVMRSRRVRR